MPVSISLFLCLSSSPCICSLWHSNNAVVAQQSVIISYCNLGTNTHIEKTYRTHSTQMSRGRSINSMSAAQHYGVYACVLVCLLQEGEEKVRELIHHQIECMAR